MKGLFLNSLYSSIGNIKLRLFMVLIVAAAVIITGSPTAQEVFVYITITILSVNAVAGSRKEAASKWNKYEITLPVCRKEIIKCKYLSYVFWTAAGSALSLAVTVTATLIHKNSNVLHGMENLYSMFTLGIGISLLTGAFFYPISYIAGIDKSEIILIISILIAIGTAITVLNTLNRFIPLFTIRMPVFIAFYLVIFIVSYGLTLCIYSKKEI